MTTRIFGSLKAIGLMVPLFAAIPTFSAVNCLHFLNPAKSNSAHIETIEMWAFKFKDIRDRSTDVKGDVRPDGSKVFQLHLMNLDLKLNAEEMRTLLDPVALVFHSAFADALHDPARKLNNEELTKAEREYDRLNLYLKDLQLKESNYAEVLKATGQVAKFARDLDLKVMSAGTDSTADLSFNQTVQSWVHRARMNGILAVPSARTFTIRDLNYLLGVNIVPIGLIVHSAWADGHLQDPIAFLAHDIGHLDPVIRAIVKARLLGINWQKILSAIDTWPQEEQAAAHAVIFARTRETYFAGNFSYTGEKDSDLNSLISRLQNENFWEESILSTQENLRLLLEKVSSRLDELIAHK